MSQDRCHANALVIAAIVVIVVAGSVLVSVMVIIVHVTSVILAVTMNFLVTRNVIAVVPVVLHKEDSLAAGVVLAAVLAPVFCLTWRYTQINRSCCTPVVVELLASLGQCP
jgi:Na+-translocating ferredoxin:NAD+ oxidoreductase RnfD subunit